MEQSYWLKRTRVAAAMARRARSSEARLVHLDLAGRYSIKAAMAPAIQQQSAEARVALSLAAPDSPWADAGAAYGGIAYYERLETGARWLATRAAGAAERDEHISMANRYARLRLDAVPQRRR
jgi:hypothetical protein